MQNERVIPPKREREAARRGIEFLNRHFPMFHLDLNRLDFLSGPNSPLEQLMPGGEFSKTLKQLNMDVEDAGRDARLLGFRATKSPSWAEIWRSNRDLVAAWRYEWPRVSRVSSAGA